MLAETKVMWKIRNKYEGKTYISEADYEKSRNLFLCEGCCANGIFALTTGAFLSGYAHFLGLSTPVIGIVSAFPTLLNSVQIISSVLMERKASIKGIITLFALIHRLLLASMFFVPFLVSSIMGRTLLLVSFYFIAHFFGGFIGTGAGSWLLSLVEPHQAGKYLGKKDSMSLFVLTITSLVMGHVLDYFKGIQQEGMGFIVIGVVVFGFAILNFLCLTNIEEPRQEREIVPVKLLDTWKQIWNDRKFRDIIYFYGFWNIAINVAAPFFSLYMVVGLKLSYFYIMFMTLLSSAARIGAAIIWGKFVDSKSCVWVAKMSIGMLGIVHCFYFFLVLENYIWLLPILQIVGGIAWGGIAISTFQLQYTYAPIHQRVSYVSFNTAVTGLIGFLATVVGSSLIGILKDITVLSIEISNMQQLFLLSGVGMLGCVLYLKKRE